jgi:Zn-dependent peptidase ImmA (M78 family)/DNA-binding transcriptional regulator YiaG
LPRSSSTANRTRGTAREPIPIESSVLRWARESIGLSVSAAAKKAGVRPSKLDEWEQEEALPTARQLERFANIYKRPLAVFFRTEPPPEPPLPADFRVLKAGRSRGLSPASLLAIRRARHLQTSYAELRGPLEVSIQLDSQDPERSAQIVRPKLGVPLNEQFYLQSDDAALRKWRRAVERTDVLVFQFPFPVEEMRGFSLPGEVPLIVLNNRDAYSARCFTLFHEAAHVWLGKPGICNPDGRVRVRQKSDSLEAFCNAVAAELLVPMRAFLSDEKVVAFRNKPADVRTVLDATARRFHVSPQVSLRRLLTAQLISESVYQDWASRLSAEAKARIKSRKPSTGGPTPSRKALSELGEPFVRTVLGARNRGAITDADVTDYLSVGYEHVEKIESMLT